MSKASPTGGAQPLRPRARLMLTLGLELISSESVAVAELVKNAFDADARHVLLRLTGPVKNGAIPAGRGRVEVLDDGHGMDASVLVGTWLEPATAHRRRARRSASGRRLLGEKGVGRFAAAKLATQLELISRTADGDEARLELDWDDFLDEDLYLDQVDIDWSSGPPAAFKKAGQVGRMWRRAVSEHLGSSADPPAADQGTLLRLDGTRKDWDAELVQTLRRSLSRMVRPFADQSDLTSDFTIVLDVPAELGELSGVLGPPEELEHPHYTLDAVVGADGLARGSMTLKDGPTAEIDYVLRRVDHEAADGDNPLRCGPFEIHLRVWDRDVPSLAELAETLGGSTALVRKTLDDVAGVSVYRDGFRVLPYGEPNNDWLRLDLRRVQEPTRRLSNNQIVGYLTIGRDSNPELLDQTNREGIVEGPALDDLRHAVLQLLTLLEVKRYDIRPRRERRPRGGLLDRISLEELRQAIVARLPEDRGLVAMVADLQGEIDTRLADVGEALARYHRLATLGQLVDRLVHELGQPMSTARQAATVAIERLRKGEDDCVDAVERALPSLETVLTQLRVAGDVVRRVQPFGGRRRGRPQVIRLETAITQAVDLLEPELLGAAVQVELPVGATDVTVDGTELQEVVVNLLTNSVFWLRSVPKKARRVAITTGRNRDGSVWIEVEDSGPGVDEEHQPHIFEPYFTTREGGMGLGLAIAGEIVEDFYGGTLELLPAGDLGGARFRATLRRRVGSP